MSHNWGEPERAHTDQGKGLRMWLCIYKCIIGSVRRRTAPGVQYINYGMAAWIQATQTRQLSESVETLFVYMYNNYYHILRVEDGILDSIVKYSISGSTIVLPM